MRRQHFDDHHRRSHHRDRPFSLKRAPAPSFERRPQEPERGKLQHCSWVARSNEDSVASKRFISKVLQQKAREQRRDRLRNARTVAAMGLRRVSPHECAPGTTIGYFRRRFQENYSHGLASSASYPTCDRCNARALCMRAWRGDLHMKRAVTIVFL